MPSRDLLAISRKKYPNRRDDWSTPLDFFLRLDQEFNFTLDACASVDNTKCDRYITREVDAFTVSWVDLAEGGAVWVNPPYQRGLKKWVMKAYQESLKGVTVVMLVIAHTDTTWWHDIAMRAQEIRLVKGLLEFSRRGRAPFASAVLIFRERTFDFPILTSMDAR